MEYVPGLLVLAFFLWAWDWPRTNNAARACVAVLCVALGANYLVWRITNTVFVPGASVLDQAWLLFVWVAEFLVFIEVCIFFLIMSRTSNRSPQADAYEVINDGWSPSVDIFIPTYNEPLDVLEKTIVGAKNVDWPNKNVWVLDDGRRDWLHDYCREHNVGYITRKDNSHAKAGNINNGLAKTSGEFVCVFDADFVPFKNFIRRTVGFFRDPAIGIVQTPQHFYNKDPIQTNLCIPEDVPDEQRLFFDEMANSRDAWDAAFCCGSCSIQRRAALEAVGGVPTESITEDLLSTLVMLRKGYRTIYLNERLSMGLAAESIHGYFTQRERWCRGAIQSLYLKEGPLGPGLTFLQRVLFFPTSWLVQAPTRIMLVFVPIMYLIFGYLPFHFTGIDQLLLYQVPVILAFFFAMRWFVGGKYIPFLNISTSLFTSFRMWPVIVTSLIKPFGVGFRVTPKGSISAAGRVAEKYTFFVILVYIMLTLLGMFINVVPEWGVVKFDQFFPVAVFWCLVNIVIMLITGLICFEGPRYRKEERFTINEPVEISAQGGNYRGMLKDLSVSGCRIELDTDVPCRDVRVNIPEVGWVAIELVRSGQGIVSGKLTYVSGQRDLVIAKLFSGKYSNAISEVRDYIGTAKKILNRALN